MVRMTVELIRSKAEHHSGLLQDLEEISLHQLKLEKIENIAQVAPRLKILYLQNNIINKIENIQRLKDLRYLNLALNNITTLSSGLEGCEKLDKLDLTVNFIDVDEFHSSLESLALNNIHLKELYLTGNPCTTNFKDYRLYVIAMLPNLKKLDGTDVTRSEKIKAQQMAENMTKELELLAAQKRKEKASTPLKEEKEGKITIEEEEDPEAASQKKSAYTPEERTRMYKEQEEIEKAKETKRKDGQDFNAPADPWKEAQAKLNEKAKEGVNGELPKQRNVGRWEFSIVQTDDGQSVIIEIAVQKFLDTSLIDVDLHPRWLQCIIKGKAILLHTDCEVLPDRAKVQRIQTTGALKITLPKANPTILPSFSSQSSTNKEENKSKSSSSSDTSNSSSSSSSSSTSSSETLDLTSKNASATTSKDTNFRTIVKKDNSNENSIRQVSVRATLEETKKERVRQEREEQDRLQREQFQKLGIDDSDVPPLEDF